MLSHRRSKKYDQNCIIKTISTLQPFHTPAILVLQNTIAHLPLASTLASSVAAVNKLSPAGQCRPIFPARARLIPRRALRDATVVCGSDTGKDAVGTGSLGGIAPENPVDSVGGGSTHGERGGDEEGFELHGLI
jgi:hypothetical protein